jgi:hypothetical protein
VVREWIIETVASRKRKRVSERERERERENVSESRARLCGKVRGKYFKNTDYEHLKKEK